MDENGEKDTYRLKHRIKQYVILLLFEISKFYFILFTTHHEFLITGTKCTVYGYI